MILTAEERVRFERWLRQEIESNNLSIKQLEKLSMGDPFAEQMKIEIGAGIIIIAKLRSIE